MRAELARTEAPDEVVASATWDGRRTRVAEGLDPELAAAVSRIFRPMPVVVDDPSLRAAGTNGPVTLEPGGLRWFIAAARSRAEAEGLTVRLAADDGPGMGWDPAGAYRTFRDVVAAMGPSAAVRD